MSGHDEVFAVNLLLLLSALFSAIAGAVGPRASAEQVTACAAASPVGRSVVCEAVALPPPLPRAALHRLSARVAAAMPVFFFLRLPPWTDRRRE